MKVDRTLTRAFALFKFFEKDYPNFDGEIPDDEFYRKFKIVSDGLTLSSFHYFKADLALLGLISRQGRYSKLMRNKVLEYQKTETKTEKEVVEMLYKKLKE